MEYNFNIYEKILEHEERHQKAEAFVEIFKKKLSLRLGELTYIEREVK
jgi:hypothetical protein